MKEEKINDNKNNKEENKMIESTNEMSFIKIDNKENPKEIRIETEHTIMVINADGFSYKSKKGQAATHP